MLLQKVSLPYLSCAVIVLLVVHFFWKKRWHYYYGLRIQGPFCLPFIGNLPFLLTAKERFYENLLELGAKYKRIGKIWLGPRLYVFVTDPEYIECIMKQCLARDDLYELATPSFGHGLLTAPPELWKAHRKIINQTFSQSTLNSYHDVFVKYAKTLVTELNANIGANTDMFPTFSKTFFSIICETCLGIDASNWNKQNEYFTGLQRGVEISTARLMNPLFFNDTLWYYFGLMKEQNKLTNDANEYVHRVFNALLRGEKLILDTKRQEPPSEYTTRDFLGHLIKITNEEKWSRKELVDETQTMIVGGIDTSSTTMSFLFLMLGLHQDVQEKVYEEIFAIFGDSDRDVLTQDLDAMVYTERVIKESMRLFPVGPLLLRKSQREFKVDNIVIPSDCTIMILTSYLHRDPNVWAHPSVFNPDRFLPEEVEKRSRYSHLPFGVPPRNCIGLKFAMMAMKVLISSVLRKLKIVRTQYKSVEDIDLKVKILLSAANGYGVTFQPRDTVT